MTAEFVDGRPNLLTRFSRKAQASARDLTRKPPSRRRKRVVDLWWSRSRSNFGDALNPLIVEAVFKSKVRWAAPEEADLFAIGSLVQRVRTGRVRDDVTVWGSGYIGAPDRPDLAAEADYIAVRGRHTRDALGDLASGAALGDPGLLVGRLLRPPAVKRSGVVLVPHFADQRNPTFRSWATQEDVRTVDVGLSPVEVVNAISTADFVISSSLHGLVVADSLGIPNAWAPVSDLVTGDGFKFRDYYSALGDEPMVIGHGDWDRVLADAKAYTDTYSRDRIPELCDRLVQVAESSALYGVLP